MRIALLNHSPYGNSADARSNAFLASCARWLSVPLRTVEVRRLKLWCGVGQDEIAPDEVVLPRADIRDARDLWLVQSALRSLEENGTRVLVASDALALAEDKLRFAHAMQRAGLPALPVVAVRAAVAPPPDLDQVVQRLGGYPICLKLPFGSGGMGVVPCRDSAALRALLTYSHVLAPSELVLLQPFVAHESSLCVRLVQGRVLHATRSYVQSGELRSNARLGGRTEVLRESRLLDDLAALCGRTLAVTGLGAGAVDVLEARDGRRIVLGVSAVPSFAQGDGGERRFAEAWLRQAVGGSAHPPLVRLVTPFGLEDPRGNAVATGRIAASLRDEGLDVGWEVVGESAGRSEARVTITSGIVHGIHAGRSGGPAHKLAEERGWPLVLSFRGTDLEVLERAGAGFTAIVTSARAAKVVTVLSEEQRRRLVHALPEVAGKVRVVPQGVRLPRLAADRVVARVRHGIGASDPLVVQVAGVRREKGLPGCLRVLELARAAHPGLVYRLVGPVLDAELGKQVAAWFADKPWARHAGALRHEDALALLAAADASLHTGESEGQSNALLESLALGVPVVVRDTAAARAVVSHERDGLLEPDSEGLARALVRLLADRGQAQRLAEGGRVTVAERFTPEAELEGYLACYRAALGDG